MTTVPSSIVITQKTRILVADDEDDFRGVVVNALREDGYDVIEARNGDELLEIITPPVIFRPPDAIVADIWMPGVDGLSVAAGLRGLGWETPIVFMSANVTDDVRKRSRELRADGLFQKPFEMRDLRRDIQVLVRRSRSCRSVAPTLPDIA